jgi:hypothetical protein
MRRAFRETGWAGRHGRSGVRRGGGRDEATLNIPTPGAWSMAAALVEGMPPLDLLLTHAGAEHR